MESTILVCDNEEVLRGLVSASLEGNGYTLVEARDGDEAVEQARLVRPDLILLDMMMPGQTGLEVLAELRGDPGLRDIPVVMLTARAQATDREAARLAGADSFLAKPFSPLELACVVKELLGNGRP
jgi:two-component system response regulator MtrA